MRPRTIYLIGRAGTGKYTIAKEIIKSGYKLVDNHLINNAVFSLLNRGEAITENAWNTIEKIRDAVLDFISQDMVNNYILTNELNEEKDCHNIYDKVKSAAEKRNSIFIPIKLHISYEENARRIIAPERAAKLKTLKIRERDKMPEMIKLKHENLMEVDVTTLEAHTAASKIY